MKQISKDKFLKLAESVVKTPFFESLDWQGDSLRDIIHYWNDDSDYEYDELIEAVENVISGNQVDAFPKPLSDLADYIYGFAIDRNDAARINNYGALFYTGRNGCQDYNKAAHYYQIASDLGCPYAVENLGYIFYYGRTGTVDYEKAFMQFAKGSAVFNRACSTYKLGDMYKNGYHVNKDAKSAYMCYVRAESLIDNDQVENRAEFVAPDIYFRLAEANHYGMGSEINLKEALSYYQKAELGFITKLENGDFLIKNMLTQSIEKQQEVRKKITEELPTMDWSKK